MNYIQLFEHYQKMRSENIILAFRGSIFQDTLVLFAEAVKSRITEMSGKPDLVKRIFTIFIELAQNIVHYSAERTPKADDPGTTVGAGALAVSEEANGYLVMAGNLVRNAELEILTAKLDAIRQLDRDGLKRLYREKLREPRREGKTGGGVGLIEIARKADGPLDYREFPVDGTFSFFIVSAKILKEASHAEA